MAGNDGPSRLRKLAVDHVQVGAADTASADAEPNLALSGIGNGKMLFDERLAGAGQNHGRHAGRHARASCDKEKGPGP